MTPDWTPIDPANQDTWPPAWPNSIACYQLAPDADYMDLRIAADLRQDIAGGVITSGVWIVPESEQPAELLISVGDTTVTIPGTITVEDTP